MFVGRVLLKSRVGHRRISSLPVLPLSLLANAVPCTLVSRPRCVRASSQIRSCLGADAGASGPACADKYRERFSLLAGPTGWPCAKDRRALRKRRRKAVGKLAKLVGHREARRRFLGFVLPCQSLPKNRSHSCSKLGVKKPICIRSRMSVREKKRPSATSSEIFGLAWVRVVNTCTSSRSRLLSNT